MCACLQDPDETRSMAKLSGRGFLQPCHLPAPCAITQFSTRPVERVDTPRQFSNSGASTSGREGVTTCSAWLGSKDFDNSKLSVRFLSCADEKGPLLPAPRKYTLTHSDVTGQLWLSVGQQYNNDQLSGWYLKLFRDEVLAEWLQDKNGKPQLHLFCHISSNEKWSGPIPPAVRSRIFQKEMPLVLKTLLHGDQQYFSRSPSLMGATVFLHLSSHVQALNIFVEWGILGDESTWRQPILNWFELWWRSSVTLSHQRDVPSEPCLTEIAERALEKTQTPISEERPSLDVALSSAPATCSRAQACLNGSDRVEEQDSLLTRSAGVNTAPSDYQIISSRQTDR